MEESISRRHEYRGWRLLNAGRSVIIESGTDAPDDDTETAELTGLRGRLRRLVGFGLMRATTPLRTVIRSGQPISARARLKSARIRERYFYYRHISRNDSSGLREDPSGEIKLILPYDGDKYFTRQAYEDVVRARNHGADRNDALVGFLAFSGYDKTDLGEVLELDENHGSYPIEMRLPESPKPGEEDLALADNTSGQIVINYRPRHQPRQADPVRLEIEISDPDNAEIPWPPPGVFDGLDSNIMRQVAFKPALSLLMTVQLNLPLGLARGARATVKDVLAWSTD